MRTIQQKLESLSDDSVWIFTKQSTVFDEAFRAAKLFNDSYQFDVNLEDYFSEHYLEYGLSTDRHRIWVISQLFGLITKTPFYSRGSAYQNERPTAIFDLLNQCEIGDRRYNTLKSEQLLKVRIKPIIDTTAGRYDQIILPLLFSFLVLRRLHTEHSIQSIPVDQFITYVMTCKRFSEIDESVNLLAQNPEISNFIDSYKDRSRIIPLFSYNSNLILFERNHVSINPIFEEYFSNFVSNLNISEVELLLEDQNAYAYFLYNCQNFNVNLIDNPVEARGEVEVKIKPIREILETFDESETYDSNYVELVDEVKEENINPEIAKDAYQNPLQFSESRRGTKVIKNPIFGKISIQKSNYLCIADSLHLTFESKKNGKNFMEAHHLIPIKYAKNIFDEYNINVDCVENLVSLCPNCHRAVHYGSNAVKRSLLTILFIHKTLDYERIGLCITLDELLNMYI